MNGRDDNDAQGLHPVWNYNTHISDEANRDRWRQERLAGADQVQWHMLPDRLLEEHEWVQMQLEIDQGLFIPTDATKFNADDVATGHVVDGGVGAADSAAEEADDDEVSFANDNNTPAKDANNDNPINTNTFAPQDGWLASSNTVEASSATSTLSEVDEIASQIIDSYSEVDLGEANEEEVRDDVARRLRDYLDSRSGHGSEGRRALVGRGRG